MVTLACQQTTRAYMKLHKSIGLGPTLRRVFSVTRQIEDKAHHLSQKKNQQASVVVLGPSTPFEPFSRFELLTDTQSTEAYTGMSFTHQD